MVVVVEEGQPSHLQVEGEEEGEEFQLQARRLQAEEREEVAQEALSPLQKQAGEEEGEQISPDPKECLSQQEEGSQGEGCTPLQRETPRPPLPLWTDLWQHLRLWELSPLQQVWMRMLPEKDPHLQSSGGQ